MKFKELFQDVEDWFWKLEFNPETQSYELYLGIPNDWVYSQNNENIKIEQLHQLEDNSIIKISSNNETVETVEIDEIIEIAKTLILKNQVLEKRKQIHKEEMEKLKDILIEKERTFLEYVDAVKQNTTIIEDNLNTDLIINTKENNDVDVLSDIEKLNLK